MRPVRTYYDHEDAYRLIAERGGRAWDDLPTLGREGRGPYDAIVAFLDSAMVVPGDALDLGCGGGQVSILLAARGHRVVGVDFSPTAVALARRNAPESTFVVGDCLDLDLPTASFDLAVDNHVLHCILGPDRRRFLSEVARVLRPGGVFFSDTMSREGYVDFERHQIDPVSFVSSAGNRYLVSADELDAELGAAGLEILTRDARPDAASAIGHSLVRVARRLTTPADHPIVR